MSDDFQIAFERARKRIGEQLWDGLSSRAQTIEIYQELHALDAERLAESKDRNTTTSGGDATS